MQGSQNSVMKTVCDYVLLSIRCNKQVEEIPFIPLLLLLLMLEMWLIFTLL